MKITFEIFYECVVNGKNLNKKEKRQDFEEIFQLDDVEEPANT